MKKHIPNFLTSMNVLAGSIACVMAIEGHFGLVVVCIVAAAIFDFFDGFSARLLKAYSPIGKELDSLADVISFGLAPALLVFKYLSINVNHYSEYPLLEYTAYFSFLIVIFSALRLAKFNIDERQTTSFIGLPTPANALFWISFCYGLSEASEEIQKISFFPTLILIIIFSLLLTAEIPMFSLKVKNYKWKGNELRYLLLVFVVAAVGLAGILGIAASIVFYITISIGTSKLQKKIN